MATVGCQTDEIPTSPVKTTCCVAVQVELDQEKKEEEKKNLDVRKEDSTKEEGEVEEEGSAAKVVSKTEPVVNDEEEVPMEEPAPEGEDEQEEKEEEKEMESFDMDKPVDPRISFSSSLTSPIVSSVSSVSKMKSFDMDKPVDPRISSLTGPIVSSVSRVSKMESFDMDKPVDPRISSLTSPIVSSVSSVSKMESFDMDKPVDPRISSLTGPIVSSSSSVSKMESFDMDKPVDPRISSLTSPIVSSVSSVSIDSLSDSLVTTESSTSLPLKRPLDVESVEEEESLPPAKIPHIAEEEPEVKANDPCQATTNNKDVSKNTDSLEQVTEDQSEDKSQLSVNNVEKKVDEVLEEVIQATSATPSSDQAVVSTVSSCVIDMPVLTSPQPLIPVSETNTNTSVPPETTPSTMPLSLSGKETPTVSLVTTGAIPDSGVTIPVSPPALTSTAIKSESLSINQPPSIPCSEPSVNSKSVLHQLLSNQSESITSTHGPTTQTNTSSAPSVVPQGGLLDQQKTQKNEEPHPSILSVSQTFLEGDVTGQTISPQSLSLPEDVALLQSSQVLPIASFDSVESLSGPDSQAKPLKEVVPQTYLSMADDQILSSTLEEILSPELFQTPNIDSKPSAISTSFTSPLIAGIPSVEDISVTSSSSSLSSSHSSMTSLLPSSSSSLLLPVDFNSLAFPTLPSLPNVLSQIPPVTPPLSVLPITSLISSVAPPLVLPSLSSSTNNAQANFDSFSNAGIMSVSAHESSQLFNIPTSLNFQSHQATPIVSLKLPIPPPSVQSIFSFPNPLVSNAPTPDSIPDPSSLDGTPIDEGTLLATVTSELGVESIDPSLLNMSDLLSFLPSNDMALDDLAIMGGETPSETIVLQEGVGGGALTPSEVESAIGKFDDLGLTLKDIPLEIKDTVQAILKSQEELDKANSPHPF